MSIKLQESFASIPSLKVTKACNKYVAWHEEQIRKKEEALIDRIMDGWFAPKTREKAREELIDQGPFGDFQIIQFHGGESLIRVKNLRDLARIAGSEPVFVSAQDAGILFDFFEVPDPYAIP